MATFTLSDSQQGQSGDYVVVPAGTYYAEVVSVTVRDSNFDDERNPGQKQKEVRFQFRIVDDRYPDVNGQFVWGRTPTTFTNHENCKLRMWVEEIFNFNTLPVGFEFDTDSMVGQPVQVVVKNRNGRDRDGNPKVFASVDTVLRVATYEDSSDAF